MASLVRNKVFSSELLVLSCVRCWTLHTRLRSLPLFFRNGFCENKSKIKDKSNGTEIKDEVILNRLKVPRRSLLVADRLNNLIQSGSQEKYSDDLKLAENNIETHIQSDTATNVKEDVSKDKFLKEFDSREKAMQPGEFVMIDHQEEDRAGITKMFQLKSSYKLNTPYGKLDNNDIVGCLDGKKFRTSKKKELLVRRASLSEYVLNMKQKATIASPETSQCMLSMIDVSPGDIILDAGSGSGSLALFLSKSVGSGGHVYSLELREDHLDISKENYDNWRESYNKSHREDWPDNTTFHLADVYNEKNVLDILGNRLLDGICLDLLSVLPALPVLVTKLRHGKCISIYYPHMTQVIELYNYIQKNCLPLQVEGVYEVMPRNWIIKPIVNESEEEESTTSSDDGDNYIAPSYMCKPEISSTGYAAFLIKVRKIDVKLPQDQDMNK